MLNEVAKEDSDATGRHLSLLGLIAIGVGGTIGSGVFTLTGVMSSCGRIHYWMKAGANELVVLTFPAQPLVVCIFFTHEMGAKAVLPRQAKLC